MSGEVKSSGAPQAEYMAEVIGQLEAFIPPSPQATRLLGELKRCLDEYRLVERHERKLMEEVMKAQKR